MAGEPTPDAAVEIAADHVSVAVVTTRPGLAVQATRSSRSARFRRRVADIDEHPQSTR
jgi:hypothetical protein